MNKFIMLADLERAVKSRNESSVNLILENNPHLNTPESGKILWLAVLDDELEIASSLIRAGANLNVRKPNNNRLEETFLHYLGGSVDPRHRRLALLMLDHGADVNARDKCGISVLFRVLVAKHSDVNFIGELLLRGARVDWEELCKTSEHPLAAELLPMILELGFVDVETRQERAEYALYFACDVNGNESDTLAAVKSLFDMKLSLRKSYVVVVGALVRSIDSDKHGVVRFLLDQGINVNEKLFCGATPMYSACRNASLEMMELLLSRGADLNVVDDLGDTPFSSIPDLGQLGDKCRLGIKHFTLLVSKGREINARDRTIIENNAEMKMYYDQSLEELRMMRMMNVFNSITFYDVITRDVRRLSFLVRNRNFVKSFKEYPCQQKFPLFCKELEEIFDNAESRRERLLEKELSLREELDDVLPYVPLEKIMFYLYLSEEVDVKN